MKMKTLVVFASAAALPLGAAWATQPTGPQGTGWYGYNPDPASLAMLDRNGDGVISAEEYAAANLGAERRAPAYGAPSAGGSIPPQYDRNGDGVISRHEQTSAGATRSSGPYSGPSWETNPPVPPQ